MRPGPGSAAVVGTLHALAARKAKANVVGAIGIVENMPDGNAYRPGDVFGSLDGKTVEIINTDAEGRLAIVAVESERYRKLASDPALKQVRAMRSKRA